MTKKETRYGQASNQLATRQTSIDYWGWLNNHLPNPDIVLEKAGQRVTILRDLLTDSRVWASVGNRKSGVLSMEWELDRGKAKSRAAKAVQAMLEQIDIHAAISGILDAVLFGYQPLEMVYDKARMLTAVELKPQEWFVFGKENELRFLSRTNNWEGEELDPRRIICAVNGGTYRNPYGESILSRVYWPVAFKKGGFRFWLAFSEKFGTPWVHGKLPMGKSQAEVDAYANELANMARNSVFATTDDASVELVAAATSANSDLYKAIIDQSNSEISAAILGHAGAGESTPGKLGSETAAVTVRQEIIDGDRRLVEGVMNRIIKIWMDVNAISGEPPAFVLYQEEDVDLTLAERDEKLSTVMQSSGLKLSKEYFRREYGLAEEDMEDVEQVQTGNTGTNTAQPGLPDTKMDKQAQFAESAKKDLFPDQTAIDQIAIPTDRKTAIDPMTQDALRIFKAADDYTDAMTDLAMAYPHLDTDALTELLGRAMFVAEVWGRISAQGEMVKSGTAHA